MHKIFYFQVSDVIDGNENYQLDLFWSWQYYTDVQ